MAKFNVSDLPVDYVALIGFTTLCIFYTYKLTHTYTRPVDLVANISLIIGLASFPVYYYRKITQKIDEKNNTGQKYTRIVGHFGIILYFLLTLTSYSNAIYNFYDNFGILGNVFLLWAVSTNNLQLVGNVLFALYFFFATYRKTQVQTGAETINLVGRVLLTLYFVTVSIIGLIDMHK